MYKELNGEVFSNSDYTYDDKVNPYYKSELALNDGSLLKYSCRNNWIESVDQGTGEKFIREITYNENGYPIIITTDYDGPGRRSTKKYVYNCLTRYASNYLNNEIFVFPNPVKDRLQVVCENSSIIKSLYIIDLKGERIKYVTNTNQINVMDIAKGIYFLEINLNKVRVLKKIIISN